MVLFSENIQDLQHMIDSVNTYSNENNLYINFTKTKIVIFRNRGKPKQEEKWFLNGDTIDICNEFMYLGLLFYYTGNFVNTQKRLSEQGKKAVYSMFNKIQDDYYNHETLLTLFETYVASILNYGCEIWGFHKAPDIERVHLYFLKRILKVKKSTVNNMVYCELGRIPMCIEREYRMVKYWIKLLCTDNCLLKNCYDEMFSSCNTKPKDKQNWCCKIKDILGKYGFNFIWLSQKVDNVDFF